MTKENHDRLTKYESILSSAVKSSYARLLESEMREIAEVYKDHFGIALTKSQLNCSTCKLHALQRIGKDYFEYVEVKPKKRIKKVVDELSNN